MNRESAIMNTPDSMNIGKDLSTPSSAPTIFGRVIGIVLTTEPSLGRAQEMNRYLDKEGLSSVGYDVDTNGVHRAKIQLSVRITPSDPGRNLY